MGPLSHNGLKTSSKNSKENTNERKDRQTIGRPDFFDSIYEHNGRFQQKGHF